MGKDESNREDKLEMMGTEDNNRGQKENREARMTNRRVKRAVQEEMGSR